MLILLIKWYGYGLYFWKYMVIIIINTIASLYLTFAGGHSNDIKQDFIAIVTIRHSRDHNIRAQLSRGCSALAGPCAGRVSLGESWEASGQQATGVRRLPSPRRTLAVRVEVDTRPASSRRLTAVAPHWYAVPNVRYGGSRDFPTMRWSETVKRDTHSYSSYAFSGLSHCNHFFFLVIFVLTKWCLYCGKLDYTIR